MNFIDVMCNKLPGLIADKSKSASTWLEALHHDPSSTLRTRLIANVAKSIIRPFKTVFCAVSEEDNSELTYVFAGFGGACVAIVTLPASLPLGFFSGIGLSVLAGVLSFPFMPLVGLITASSVLAVANFCMNGIFGGICEALIGRKTLQHLRGQAAVRPQQPVQIQPAIPANASVINENIVTDYITQLSADEQAALLLSIKDKFPALVQQTLGMEGEQEQAAKLSTSRILVAKKLIPRAGARKA